MATTTTVPPYRHFHGEAHVLSGHLQRPVEQKIEKHAEIVLKDQKDSHLTRSVEEVNIEGLVSIKNGRTRVSGSRSLKDDPKNHGFVTISTAVLEGLNVFEVITADRVVAQVAIDYPLDSGRKNKDGHIEPANYPHVTLLGTQYNNVRVSGGLLTIKLNLGIVGEREGDTSYLAHGGFLKNVRQQNERNQKLAKDKNLPELESMFAGRIKVLDNLKGEPKVTFSIIENIDNLDAIPVPGVKVVGHVLVLPHFGTVALGEVDVSEVLEPGSSVPGNLFELTMFKITMGCVGSGTVNGAVVSANAGSGPGHH
jgi:hypothetical protein